MPEHIIEAVAISLLLGASAVLLAKVLKMPALLFFLLFGLVAGPTALGLIETGSLEGVLIMPLVEISVAVILFEGGLALPLAGLKSAPAAIRRVLVIALPVTGFASMLAAHFIAGLPVGTSALFGSIIVVTGPTVIGPLLRNVALSQRIDNVLRWEAIWGDAIAVVLSGVVLEMVLSPETHSGWAMPLWFMLRLGIGAAIGASAGLLLGRFVLPWVIRMGDPTLPGMVALTSAVSVFLLSNSIAESSGVVAAATAGMVLARHPIEQLDSIRHFKDQITTLLVAFLFVLLSARIDLGSTDAHWPVIVGTALLLVFVIRPVAVVLALKGSTLSMRERVFVGLTGPRGIIAAAVASYFGFRLTDPAFEVDRMVLLTFAVIFISGGFVSLLGSPLARLLGVALNEYKTGIIIIGYSPFSRSLALILKKYIQVIIVDSDPLKCFWAGEDNIPTTCTSGLSDELYEDLMEQGYRRALVLTPNSALNSLIAEKAETHLGHNRVFIAISENGEVAETIKLRAGRKLAFAVEGLDIGRANRMLMAGSAEIRSEDTGMFDSCDLCQPLAKVVDGGIRILRASDTRGGEAISLVRMDCTCATDAAEAEANDDD